MFFPDPQRNGEIDFVFAKKFSYRRRLEVIVVLAAAGFAVQVLLSEWLPVGSLALGALMLLIASLLATVKGFGNVPDRLPGKREWRGADRAQLESIIEMGAKSRAWDQSLVDITCSTGVAALIGMAAAVATVAVFLRNWGSVWLATAWVVDAAVLLLPHWITGVRTVLTNDPLVIKVRTLLATMDTHKLVAMDGEECVPQMQVRTGKDGEIPCDVKLVVRMRALGDDFLGVQTQVVLNRVQGKDFVYMYCVLVAREPMGMLGTLKAPPPRGLLFEPKHEDDVDILVIRNVTTKKTGYHTNPARCRLIFTTALAEARGLRE